MYREDRVLIHPYDNLPLHGHSHETGWFQCVADALHARLVMRVDDEDPRDPPWRDVFIGRDARARQPKSPPNAGAGLKYFAPFRIPRIVERLKEAQSITVLDAPVWVPYQNVPGVEMPSHARSITTEGAANAITEGRPRNLVFGDCHVASCVPEQTVPIKYNRMTMQHIANNMMRLGDWLSCNYGSPPPSHLTICLGDWDLRHEWADAYRFSYDWAVRLARDFRDWLDRSLDTVHLHRVSGIAVCLPRPVEPEDRRIPARDRVVRGGRKLAFTGERLERTRLWLQWAFALCGELQKSEFADRIDIRSLLPEWYNMDRETGREWLSLMERPDSVHMSPAAYYRTRGGIWKNESPEDFLNYLS